MNGKATLTLLKVHFGLMILLSMFWGFPFVQFIVLIAEGARYSTDYIYYAVPFLYLIFCLIACMKRLDGKKLIVLSTAANLMIYIWSIVAIYFFRSYLYLMIAAVLGLFWLCMCNAQLESEKESGFEKI
jgi:hypothetical protein